MKRILTLLAAALLATNAHAKPRTINDCEAIEEPMAYNACLAAFGPTRGHGAAAHEQGARRRRPSFSGAEEARWERGGRVHMEFSTRHGR